jgi:hypothetical protein
MKLSHIILVNLVILSVSRSALRSKRFQTKKCYKGALYDYAFDLSLIGGLKTAKMNNDFSDDILLMWIGTKKSQIKPVAEPVVELVAEPVPKQVISETVTEPIVYYEFVFHWLSKDKSFELVDKMLIIPDEIISYRIVSGLNHYLYVHSRNKTTDKDTHTILQFKKDNSCSNLLKEFLPIYLNNNVPKATSHVDKLLVTSEKKLT